MCYWSYLRRDPGSTFAKTGLRRHPRRRKTKSSTYQKNPAILREKEATVTVATEGTIEMTLDMICERMCLPPVWPVLKTASSGTRNLSHPVRRVFLILGRIMFAQRSTKRLLATLINLQANPLLALSATCGSRITDWGTVSKHCRLSKRCPSSANNNPAARTVAAMILPLIGQSLGASMNLDWLPSCSLQGRSICRLSRISTLLFLEIKDNA